MLAAIPGCLVAQYNEMESPRGAGAVGYLFPINPGRVNYLAGTMGELRRSHFHGGIDIRTDNRIGVPVRATHDGYISRANVSAFGYGTSLYVTHPDGNVSVYGHLDRISGKLGADIKNEQYGRKTFEINLTFKPLEYPVSRGDTIALSGNTGSSQGPHLHFEIRNGNLALNPLKFGFSEIRDNLPPTAQKIALRTLDPNSRINDRFGRFEFTLVRKSNGEYLLPAPILATGSIGVELLGTDRMDSSPGRCGINYIEMYVDSQRVFSQVIENVDLEETRGILALMDYKSLEIHGKRFNRLYVADGNRLPFYPPASNGRIEVSERDRAVRILLKDEFGNSSNVRFRLKKSPMTDELRFDPVKNAGLTSEILENTLLVTSPSCPGSSVLAVYTNGQVRTIPFSYKSTQQAVYLIDLQKVLPDSVRSCAGILAFHFKDVVPSTTEYSYYSDRVDVTFPAQALYDTLFLNIIHQTEGVSESFTIGHYTTPLHKSIRVTLKPVQGPVPSKNTSVYRRQGNSLSYVGGEWSQGKVRFTTQELGEFVFLTDSLAPSIGRIRLDHQNARFRIRDGRSGIAYYEASINGQWLLMSYDYKSGILQSDKRDPKQLLKGDFELKVVDRAGNERIYKQRIL
ncbi:MAG: M23 family metallopeptidase [Cytophagales bacterium]|nr:M23 family metallopeptidase [Cytophagales bacterium]